MAAAAQQQQQQQLQPQPRSSALGDLRFYERKFPEAEELVMVKVQRIAEMGAYVSLLEYNNVEGMILLSELSKRRFRSVTKLVKVGRLEAVMVLRVDAVKGYIDLSKSRVSPEDIVKCEERYSKGKKVHQTVRHVALKHNLGVDELNAKVIWPLYKKYGHALDALKAAALDPEEVFGGLDVSEEVKKSLIQDIQLRLAPQALKLRARIDVWCFGKDGIDAVKKALLAAKEKAAETPEKAAETPEKAAETPEKAAETPERAVDTPQTQDIAVKLIAPPQYVVVTSSFDKESGMQKIQQAISRISQTIKSYRGGDFKQQGEIMVLGSEEDRRLEELLLEVSESEEEEEEEEEEEDEGMGRVQAGVPEDEVEENAQEE
ncbi:eukaryotic translation initiation factor 2 alpha subunit, putative [Eimeria tenella]|uniref:Eukaryotic translation initiation factor 2 alpha subunit, putative n=1 Tax=Eimeria tenella TaxID=5802 RepID=U6L2N5_EIMTE|nr:eukaryotic translation initiation factor 2 alpha subunit, putative [Eimeria tenella]CDJ43443.1 eukaryotic translation initiation factor 2 alpha subunit, putative [Eimeria tenella]|eukprot:XP_013234193.1 eukaryotic translation initiation factor 2 alpha subunit, putative [Eimeria tenella]